MTVLLSKVLKVGLVAMALSLSACESVSLDEYVKNQVAESKAKKAEAELAAPEADAGLVAEVKKALESNSQTSRLRVSVSADGDSIILKGVVGNSQEKHAAEQVAGRVAGVKHVVNTLFVD